MMPGIAPNRRAFHGFGFAKNKTKKKLFDDDDQDKHQQSERLGSPMGRDNLVRRPERDSDRRQQKNGGDERGGKRLSFAVAVGMVLVRWRGRQNQAPPNDNRTENVRERLDSIGHQGMRMTDHSGREL